jgi:uncharacterized protein YqkB
MWELMSKNLKNQYIKFFVFLIGIIFLITEILMINTTDSHDNANELNINYESIDFNTPQENTVLEYAPILRSNFNYMQNVTNINFTWTPGKNTNDSTILLYILQYTQDSGASWLNIAEGINTTFYFLEKGRLEDGIYSFRLECTNASGTILHSNLLTYRIKNFLTPIEFIYPEKNTLYFNYDRIMWTSPEEANYELILFDLYYSPDNGIMWILIEKNIIQTHYYLNNYALTSNNTNPLWISFKVIAYNSGNSTAETISNPGIYIPNTGLFHVFSTPIKYLILGALISMLGKALGLFRCYPLYSRNSFFNPYLLSLSKPINKHKLKRRILQSSILFIIAVLLMGWDYAFIRLSFNIEMKSNVFIIISFFLGLNFLIIYFGIRSFNKANESLLSILIKSIEDDLKRFQNKDNVIIASAKENLFQIYCLQAEYHYNKAIKSKSQTALFHLKKVYLAYRSAYDLLSQVALEKCNPDIFPYINSDIQKQLIMITNVKKKSDFSEIKLSISVAILKNIILASDSLSKKLPPAELKSFILTPQKLRFGHIQGNLLQESKLFINRGTFLLDALPFYQKILLFSTGRVNLIRNLQKLGRCYTEIARGGDRLDNIANAIKYLKFAASISHLIIKEEYVLKEKFENIKEKINKTDNNENFQINTIVFDKKSKSEIRVKKIRKVEKRIQKNSSIVSQLPSFMKEYSSSFWNDKISCDSNSNVIDLKFKNDTEQISYKEQSSDGQNQTQMKSFLPDLEQYLEFLRTGQTYSESTDDGDEAMKKELSLGNFGNAMKILYKEQTPIVNLKFIAFLMRDLGDAFRVLNQFIYSVTLYEFSIKSLLILETVEFLPKKILRDTRKEVLKKLNDVLNIKEDPTKNVLNPEPTFESEI